MLRPSRRPSFAWHPLSGRLDAAQPHPIAPEAIDVDTLAALTRDLPRRPSYPPLLLAHRKSTLTKRCSHFALLDPTGISEKSNAVRAKCPRQRGTDGRPLQFVVDHVPANDHVI